MSKSAGVWVYLEHSNTKFERVSVEILGKATELARKLHTKVTATILGHGVASLAEEAVRYGADRVLVADSPDLEFYRTDAFSNVLAALVKKGNPEILLMGATHDGRDLAGRLAVRLNTGLTAHAVQVELEKETDLLLCGVPGFGGSIVAVCKCPRSRPQMATIRPGIFPMPVVDPKRRGKIEHVSVDVGEARTKIVERSVTESVDIAKAELLIIAGRGAEGRMDEVRKLADLIGAGIGVTRPLADRGLMPRDVQVGSTGVAVAPKVALVLGASGAAHFVSGIRDAKLVISVNKDPEAAIKSHSDYVIADDVEDLLAALLNELQRS